RGWACPVARFCRVRRTRRLSSWPWGCSSCVGTSTLDPWGKPGMTPVNSLAGVRRRRLPFAGGEVVADRLPLPLQILAREVAEIRLPAGGEHGRAADD